MLITKTIQNQRYPNLSTQTDGLLVHWLVLPQTLRAQQWTQLMMHPLMKV